MKVFHVTNKSLINRYFIFLLYMRYFYPIKKGPFRLSNKSCKKLQNSYLNKVYKIQLRSDEASVWPVYKGNGLLFRLLYDFFYDHSANLELVVAIVIPNSLRQFLT